MLDCSVELLINSAITAPKAGGKDDVIVVNLTDNEKIKLILDAMVKISERTNFSFYKRDSITCQNIKQIIFVGAKDYYHNYNCGFCGFETCDLCKKNGAFCALTITDCGIALGSLVKLASILGIDNRIMLSLGKAAIETGVIKGAVAVYGVPLYVSSKSIFFDRKY
ncbi:MAG: DUF2148 domain-containing protein [Desulfurella sp.]|jgi:uncharacterized ferredoxin-like protein|uniref:Uncharacterized protein, contains ferredoxin domain n=1 Tax=Desulfurella multipotens TaxID=79269 RepID=A0A1G6IM23_9BACT|nr:MULTISPECIES: DUF2148 domain-containing protein [Desulfurella]PMP64924.1 MAG: ferredoxin [Desulfurella multipotens]PMP93456.1 MAG: ferredoxin [Desulfurella sp.]SDC07481.1 Uncharacterized protein, contains ferredoxin domain [Desulfurella multipotens]HEX12886.1 ferredoxin [Desulfurella acetivorans]